MAGWKTLQNAIRRGREAFRAGTPRNECPLRANQIAWVQGWDEENEWTARTNEALARSITDRHVHPQHYYTLVDI